MIIIAYKFFIFIVTLWYTFSCDALKDKTKWNRPTHEYIQELEIEIKVCPKHMRSKLLIMVIWIVTVFSNGQKNYTCAQGAI